MSRIAVLVFAPQNAPSSGRTSPDSAELTDDVAFLAESKRHRVVNLRKPYSVTFSRNSKASAPYAASPRPPLLKVHIATTRESCLLEKLSKHLSAIPPDASPEEWLDTALRSLQKADIVQRFSVPKFHQFLVDTLHKQPLAARRMSSGTTELDYLALLSSNSEVKKMLSPDPEDEDEADANGEGAGRATRTFCGFRISSRRPAKPTDRTVAPWERQDDPYGGLM